MSPIFEQRIDLIIKDDHYGYETERSKNFLSKLNYDYELALSGTPFANFRCSMIKKRLTCTYLQEQLKRRVRKKVVGNWYLSFIAWIWGLFLCKYNNDIVKISWNSIPRWEDNKL